MYLARKIIINEARSVHTKSIRILEAQLVPNRSLNKISQTLESRSEIQTHFSPWNQLNYADTLLDIYRSLRSKYISLAVLHDSMKITPG